MPDLPTRRPAPPDSVSLPLSAVREQIVAQLTQHFASGTLSIEEFEQRVGSVYAAQDGMVLRQLVADLPVVASATEIVPAEGKLSAVLSHTARHGSMAVPRHLYVRAFMGNVELDLRDATFAPGVSEIEVAATMSNVEITVPSGVRVECTGNALLGSFESRLRDTAASGTSASATIIRVSGQALLSSVEIKA